MDGRLSKERRKLRSSFSNDRKPFLVDDTPRKKEDRRRSTWTFYLGLILCAITLLFLLSVLLFQWKEHYDQRDPMLWKIKQTLSPLHPAIARIQWYEGNKSYTLNKQKIYLCLKKPGTHNYYPFNMLLYVALHEISHVLCNEIGHTDKFQYIFSSLLEKAVESGIYDPSQPILKDYCGHHYGS